MKKPNKQKLVPYLNSNTKGRKKIESYFRELLTNSSFLKITREFYELDNLPEEKITDDILEKREKLVRHICIRYCLTYYDFKFLLGFVDPHNQDEDIEKYFSKYWESDTCSISNNFCNHFEIDGALYNRPVLGNMEYETFYSAFPISIDIRLLATKNELLNFIEKNWGTIEYYLDWYRYRKNIDIRDRKNNAIYDLIWKNRKLPTKKIKEKIDEKFPAGKILGYNDVNKIKSNEKKRRDKNLKKF